jgi:protein TonB
VGNNYFLRIVKSIVCFFLLVFTLSAGSNGTSKQWPLQEPGCADATLVKGKNGKPLKFTSARLKEQAAEKVRPKYPPSCRCLGNVTAECVIDQRGKVICVRVTKGHPILRATVIEAVKQWRFKPYLQNGKTAAIYGQLEFNFTSAGEVSF